MGGWGSWGGGGSGVGGCKVDVNEELKFLGKFTTKKGGSGWWGVRLVGVRVGVNTMLGVGVMREMGTKNRRYCTVYKKGIVQY